MQLIHLFAIICGFLQCLRHNTLNFFSRLKFQISIVYVVVNIIIVRMLGKNSLSRKQINTSMFEQFLDLLTFPTWKISTYITYTIVNYRHPNSFCQICLNLQQIDICANIFYSKICILKIKNSAKLSLMCNIILIFL